MSGIHGAGFIPISEMVRCPSAAEPDWWDPDNLGLCIWSAYQPKGAANFAASLIDLSGNGNNAGDPGGASTPGWDAINGWKFVPANNEYLTTTFVSQNDQSQTVILQFTNRTSGFARMFCGVTDGANRSFGLLTDASNNRVGYYNGGLRVVNPLMVQGNLCVAGNQGYRNGVPDGAAIGAWGGAAVSALYIGCWNNAGAPASYCAYYCQAAAIYDCTLTAAQVLSVATAMAAL